MQARTGKATQGMRQGIAGTIQKVRANGAKRAARKYTPEQKTRFLRLADTTPANAATLPPTNPQKLLEKLRQGERIDLKNQREAIYQAAKDAGDAASKKMAANMNNTWVRRASFVWNTSASFVLFDKLIELGTNAIQSSGKAGSTPAAPEAAEKPASQVTQDGSQIAGTATVGQDTTGNDISTVTLSAAEAPSSESSNGYPTTAVMHFSGKQLGGRTSQGQVEALKMITKAALSGDNDAKEAADIIADGYRYCPAVEQAIRGLGGGASLERLSQCTQAQ